ncbi:MAG: hypothetical protein AAGK37_10345 [Pseudomonadota bacterium]
MRESIVAFGANRVRNAFDPAQSLLRARLSELTDEKLAELEADIGAIALGAGISSNVHELLFAVTEMREAA